MNDTRTSSKRCLGLVRLLRTAALAFFVMSPLGCGGGTFGTGTSDGARALIVFQTADQQRLPEFEFKLTGSDKIFVSDSNGEAEIDLEADLPYTAVRFLGSTGELAATYLNNSEAESTADAIPVTVLNPGDIPPQGAPASIIQCEDALPFWQGLASDADAQDSLGLSAEEVDQIDGIANSGTEPCGEKMRSIEAIAF